MLVVYTYVFIFAAYRANLLYLDDVMCAFLKLRGLVIQDWYFRGRMEMHSKQEKVKKGKDW